MTQRHGAVVHRRPRAGRVVHRRTAGAVHWRPAEGGEGARVSAHPARVDHGDAAPVHRDGLALGVQLHPRSRVGGVLHDADVSLVRALRDLDGLPHKLSVPAQAPAPPSAPPPAAATHPHVAAPLPALARVGGARQPRAHEAGHAPARPRPGLAGPRPATRLHQVAALAHEDAAVVHHHAAVEEGEVAEQVPDLALAAAVGTVYHLDHVLGLDGVLLAVQRRSGFLLPLLLERGGPHADHLAVHVKHLEGLLLDLHDNPDGLGVYLHRVPEAVLAEAVHARGPVGAELQVVGQRAWSGRY